MSRRRSGMMCWHWLLRSCGGCTQAFWRDTACALLNLQHGKTTKLENNGVADDYRSEYECLFIMIVRKGVCRIISIAVEGAVFIKRVIVTVTHCKCPIQFAAFVVEKNALIVASS